MSGSAFDYFYGISNGYVRDGEVVDWTTNPLQVTRLAHWADVADDVWRRSLKLEAGAVAPTLRERGIRTIDDLKVDGQVPEGLVFYHTDVWSGGCTRSMWQVKAQLEEAGRLDLWDSAWEAWANDVPIVILPCCHQVPKPTIRVDHTFERVPEASELRWTSSAVLMHELGHLLFGYPDLYNQYTQWYSWFGSMGADWLWNDFPPTLAPTCRNGAGGSTSPICPVEHNAGRFGTILKLTMLRSVSKVDPSMDRKRSFWRTGHATTLQLRRPRTWVTPYLHTASIPRCDRLSSCQT
ncbi:MAG: hypothetical protein HZY76_10395 [Anaerolineae bacterium]|nr:MAG: hypothetical protein HZY76_10395 [Anaerolineae bacterium]